MKTKLVYLIGVTALAISIAGLLLATLSTSAASLTSGDGSPGADVLSSRPVISPRQLNSLPVMTVTAPTDDANGDTSSVAALLADPGPDGISIREAMMASNNTPGSERIEFGEVLSGTSIMIYQNGALPILSGGGLTINGDINRDGKPDVTLDGSLGQDGGPTSNCLSIWSDGNVIAGMNITGFQSAILFAVPSFYTGTSFTMSGNQILSNTITGKNALSISPCGWIPITDPDRVSNLTWQNTLIASNEITASEVNMIFMAGVGLSQNNRILTITICGNRIHGEGEGIVMLAGDTNSAWHGIPGPVRYADNNLVQNVEIVDNMTPEIKLVASNMGNRGNALRHVRVLDNVVGEGGINVTPCYEVTLQDERSTSLNTVADVEIRGNTVRGAHRGITLRGSGSGWGQDGPAMSDNMLENITIADNIVIDAQSAGIMVFGGEKSAGASVVNDVISGIIISHNLVLSETLQGWSGILIGGGWDEAGILSGTVSSNTVSSVQVFGNVVTGYQVGLRVIGGMGPTASNNSVSGSHWGNTLGENGDPFRVVENLDGAMNNTADFPLAFSFRTYLPLVQR